MDTIRIDFCDFWPGFRKDDNVFVRLLQTRYRVELHDRPDFLIYSNFGHHHKLHSGVRIFFTGEAHRPDFSECDYAFTCHYLDDPRHLRWPLYAFYYEPEMLLKDREEPEKVLAAKTRFCSFIASNSHPRRTRKREEFFRRLSRYKPVDAGGRVFNNLGYLVPGGPLGKIDFLKRYKFNIAFENASIPGYTTEKIFEPMAARCVPIYWGNPLIRREFNAASFLNCLDFPSEEALMDRIVQMDRDDAAYLECLRQPCFPENRSTEFFSKERLLAHFEHIFSAQIRPVAARRKWFQFKNWILVKKDR